MSSLLTNASAMTALQTLRGIEKNLATTQNRIATGKRVAEAKDNPAYWSISVGMEAQNSVLSTVKDSLGLGQAILDTTYTALADAIDHATAILSKYVALETDGIDADAVNAEIDQRKERIDEIAKAATFEGQNLLKTGAADINIVTGYIRDGGGLQKLALTAFDLEAIVSTISDVDSAQTALDDIKTAAAELGALKMRLESQLSFTSQQMDAIDRGIGQLVDADMDAESARLSALQVQQQLAIQALSIANSSSQNILTLFKG
jgi:flagellin